MFIDTHAHLNFKAFKEDYAEVIRRSFNNGIEGIINVGAKLDTSQRAIDLAYQFKNLFAAIGLHPIHVNDENFDIKNYQKLSGDKKVVAIGEIGLDYFHTQDIKIIEKQKKIFREFLNLAQEKNQPVILHCRGNKEEPTEAYKNMLEILNSFSSKSGIQGVIHCFTSSPKILKNFLDLGLYVGFTGVITFAPELKETVKSAPLNKILVETDCPFMSPVPYRGKRCEPWYVKFTLEKIAEIKNVKIKEAEKQILENSKKLFGIG